MEIYKVGQSVKAFIGHAEETVFDIDDSGATLLVFFRSPRPEEIKQMSQGSPFEIRLSVLYGVSILTVKFGTLNWMDAPYTPHLSPNLSAISLPPEQMGLALTVYLVNSVDGTICHMRLLGLSEKFTSKLFAVITAQLAQPFERGEYLTAVSDVFRRYSTKEIVAMSVARCKIQ